MVLPAAGSRKARLLGVGFAYEDTPRAALDTVSFELRPGGTVALVGPSGAGKTTAAHISCCASGTRRTAAITLEDADLRSYRLDELRGQVALVAQDTYLFNASIRDNLRVARPDAGEDELMLAIERAGLADFIESLPDGLDTPVGERGAQLSGGQRQRVAIGRALLKDAPVLILDEATSHLDGLNERLVRDALDELMSDRTTLVIAHRLSTVRDADQIVVLDEGRVVEIGTHAELAVAGRAVRAVGAAPTRRGAAVGLPRVRAYRRPTDDRVGPRRCGMSEIDRVLESCGTVAVVGLSPRPDRDSYGVAQYLQEQGFRIIPVNPAATQILGEHVLPRPCLDPGARAHRRHLPPLRGGPRDRRRGHTHRGAGRLDAARCGEPRGRIGGAGRRPPGGHGRMPGVRGAGPGGWLGRQSPPIVRLLHPHAMGSMKYQ